MNKQSPQALFPSYVLTDALGFTTMCAATQTALGHEMVRAGLVRPVHVTSWTPMGDNQRGPVLWSKLDEWEV